MTKLRNEVIFKHKKGEQITKRRTRAGSVYNTCEGKHMRTHLNTTNITRGQCIQHLRT